MEPAAYDQLNNKFKSIGGLYIYRDGIRILPYGDNDVDFLNIEKRRNLGAGYYFFSYRRIFGTIEISSKNNSNLIEKAGREGFQENKAYRDFREILENFFIQIAADFFRKGGEFSDVYRKAKDEIKRTEKAKREEEKRRKAVRKKLENDLDIFFKQTSELQYIQLTKEITKNLKTQLRKATGKNEANQIAAQLIQAEVSAKEALDNLRRKYTVQKPRGVGLTRSLRRDWQTYLEETERIEIKVFQPLEKTIGNLVKETNRELENILAEKKRLSELLKRVTRSSKSSIDKEVEVTQSDINQLQVNITNQIKHIQSDLDEEIGLVENNLVDVQLSDLSDSETDDLLRELEMRVNNRAMKSREFLQHVREQIKNIDWRRDNQGNLISSLDGTAALEEELLALRERSELDLEMSQLGMAIEIINHEFNMTVKSIRTNIQRLKGWADTNPEITPLYRDIRTNFEHLDGYLTLFTPLHRRLQRSATDIKGSNIVKFLSDLFEARLKRHEIKLTATRAFRNKMIIGYPSTFYPVFVNIVDNSIFWLADSSLPRIIRLDVDNGDFILSDNGPGIPKRDHNAIFELGFSRKPGGRGLGLFISKEVLKKEGYDLTSDEMDGRKGAMFRISSDKSIS